MTFCPFCGELPEREPAKVKAGYYIRCSGCDETGPVEKTEEEAWLGWGHPFNPRRDAA